MSTSTTSRYDELTKDELYEIAQERDIDGRSEMSKEELVAALDRTDAGPDAVEVITRQHDEVRELFEEFEGLSSRSSKRKADVVRSAITLLSKHAAIEEQILYPAIRRALPDLEDDVKEDLEEHHLVEVALLELDHMSPDDERFDAKFTVVMENVRHHLEEEEGELLPRLREEMEEEARRELGAALEAAWPMAPERPHPLSPDTQPGVSLVGIPAALWDRGLNVLRFVIRTARRG